MIVAFPYIGHRGEGIPCYSWFAIHSLLLTMKTQRTLYVGDRSSGGGSGHNVECVSTLKNAHDKQMMCSGIVNLL